MTRDSKETKLKEKSKRPKRKRIQEAGPLSVDTDTLEKGFHYRIVNDTPRQKNKRLRMGYEIVQDADVIVGEGLPGSSNLGSVPDIVVDHNGMKGILMRIPDEDYQEILDELEEANDHIDETIKGKVTDNDKSIYGNITKE